MKPFTLKAKLWLYPGYARWVFATVPKKEATIIKKQTLGLKRGWGSVPVTVTLGKTTWETAIFQDKSSGSYLLPIKVAVRKKEEVMEDDTVKILLSLRV